MQNGSGWSLDSILSNEVVVSPTPAPPGHIGSKGTWAFHSWIQALKCGGLKVQRDPKQIS